jgi:thiamine-phosphate pyrophosphorylase
MLGIIRILDANVNRACEGIRTIEDLVRFHFQNERLTEQLRQLRHFLRTSYKDLDSDFILARDADEDVGKAVTQNSTLDKKHNLKQICNANFKRVTEAFRSIEEYSKIIDRYALSKEVESKRYEVYMLEKEVLNLFRRELPQGLYCITGEPSSKGRSNVDCVREMIKAGIKVIQYRDKEKTIGQKLKEAKEIAKLTKEAGVTFIVNDHIDIALAVDADGVHVGQDDMPIAEVRKLVGDKIIGLSTHSVEDAKRAMNEDVDYIGVGPIFPTTTKDRASVGLEYLQWVEDNVNIPYVAIGGINDSNINKILEHKVKHVAIVSNIVGADNIYHQANQMNNKILGGNK